MRDVRKSADAGGITITTTENCSGYQFRHECSEQRRLYDWRDSMMGDRLPDTGAGQVGDPVSHASCMC